MRATTRSRALPRRRPTWCDAVGLALACLLAASADATTESQILGPDPGYEVLPIDVAATSDAIFATAWETATGAGTVFRYGQSGSQWVSAGPLAVPGAEPADDVGRALATSGDVLAVGAPGDDDAGSNNGAIYVFRRSGSDWTFEQKVVPPAIPYLGWGFGYRLALSGDLLAGFYQGAIRVYRWSGSTWAFEQELAAPPGNAFAVTHPIAASGDVIAASRLVPYSTSERTVVLYRWNGSAWAFEQELTGPEGFGTSIAFAGDQLLVGAPAGSNPGHVQVFAWDGASWAQTQDLTGGGYQGEFGKWIASSGDTLLVSAPRPSSGGDARVYLHRRVGATWSLVDTFVRSSPNLPTSFGRVAAVAGDSIAVGDQSLGTPLPDSAASSSSTPRSAETGSRARRRSATTATRRTATAAPPRAGSNPATTASTTTATGGSTIPPTPAAAIRAGSRTPPARTVSTTTARPASTSTAAPP
jgi:hypothetical protein